MKRGAVECGGVGVAKWGFHLQSTMQKTIPRAVALETLASSLRAAVGACPARGSSGRKACGVASALMWSPAANHIPTCTRT